MALLTQTPAPGQHLVLHRGDTIAFNLISSAQQAGRGWLRTNIGNARKRRIELIQHVESNSPIRAGDWHDIPMERIHDRQYAITLPLVEVGCFEAKAFFLTKGGGEPVWPEGENTFLKVEPSEYCCANTTYTAFVRQFGPNRCRRTTTEKQRSAVDVLEEHGYTVIPRSGTFRDLIGHLDAIVDQLRFRIIQLLPIHPTPTTYARMGRYGSPYAVLDFRDVDPALAEFDRQTTPLDQFRELLDAVHERDARLFMDIPVNHTGWASKLQVQHPEWFLRNEDRTFQSPGAWGVTWEDLSELDYGHRGLWRFMADVFLYWCRQGVDGFRCDAGYMIPFEVWEYIVAKVRYEYPDTIFLLEGLGGGVEAMERLMAHAGLDWAYSELFQNYGRSEVGTYLPWCIDFSSANGTLVHFAETHDNNRLAARSQAYAAMRTALSALCSHSGGFGITNGVEWFAEEKIDVHNASPLRWGNSDNQLDHIARLNAILEGHPAFHAGAELQFVPCGAQHTIALARGRPEHDEAVLVLVNLNEREPDLVSWNAPGFVLQNDTCHDLLSGRTVTLERHDRGVRCRLAPGEALCLTEDALYLLEVERRLRMPPRSIARRSLQNLRAKALEIHGFFNGLTGLSEGDPGALAEHLARDPRAFCAAAAGGLSPVTEWRWPRDRKRTVMVPPGFLLLIQAPHRFSVELRDAATVLRKEWSMRTDDGSHMALMLPIEAPGRSRVHHLHLVVYESGNCHRAQVPVLYLSSWRNAGVQTAFDVHDVEARDGYGLCTNGRGAMAQVRGAWGEIRSRYDSILAGNLHPDYPVDRRIMFTRCRAWLVCRGYSQTVARNFLKSFAVDENGVVSWRFEIPVGMGKLVYLAVGLRMWDDANTVTLEFRRRSGTGREDHLPDRSPVRIILRPDVEDRSYHETTKAYPGPGAAWPAAVTPRDNGFSFGPSRDHRLEVLASPGTFTLEPEWTYMVSHPFEAERGLDAHSDLFSPGYFTLTLKGGQSSTLKADIVTGRKYGSAEPASSSAGPLSDVPGDRFQGLAEAMRNAIRQFLVGRDNSLTVIAGYPWFLDWGRDTLICLRGIIAARMLGEALEILMQFARFESKGTLPNMIRGGDESNRDTSDAPLWFFVACADLVRAEGSHGLLKTRCNGRSLRQVLRSIGRFYMEGTPNGIRMDPDSGLIFSPSHFTWMDTDHPAGTPREGYPIEIQALWHAALTLLAELDPKGIWGGLAGKVRASIHAYFVRDGLGHLSDCLHARPGQPAREAEPDDLLRPNQLLAVSLGALKDHNLCVDVLAACEELLVPGAIRSLADRPVARPLPIRHHGELLNDPTNPYWGRYFGDEDTRRKPAYHNGTAWTWLFPSYCEALFVTYGEAYLETALALLTSSAELINRGCVAHVPEIVDGDTPHTLRGCGAQAWGATELYRVLAILTEA